jgi:hypothetical protein
VSSDWKIGRLTILNDLDVTVDFLSIFKII